MESSKQFNQEKVIFLNLRDQNSLWYLDKEHFDDSVPLVATYLDTEEERELKYESLKMYKYLPIVLEYYIKFPIVTGFYIEAKVPYYTGADSSLHFSDVSGFVDLIQKRIPDVRFIMFNVDRNSNFPYKPLLRLFFLSIAEPDLVRSQFFVI